MHIQARIAKHADTKGKPVPAVMHSGRLSKPGLVFEHGASVIPNQECGWRCYDMRGGQPSAVRYVPSWDDMEATDWIIEAPPSFGSAPPAPKLDPSIPWSADVIDEFMDRVRELPMAHNAIVGGVESLIAQRKKLNEEYQKQLKIAEEMANRANQAGEKLAQATRSNEQYAELIVKDGRRINRLRQALKSFGLSDTIIGMLEE